MKKKPLKDSLDFINSKVYQSNKFRKIFDGWVFVKVNLYNFNNSEIIFNTCFSSKYGELLYNMCKNLKMPFLYTFIPYESSVDNYIFFKVPVNQINDSLVKKSAYLQNITSVYEENDYDIFCSNSVRALFEYDDLKTLKVVCTTLKTYLIMSSRDGISKNVKILIKNIDKTFELKSSIEPILISEDKTEVPVDFVKELSSGKTNKIILTRKETATLLNISLPTLNTWTKNGILKKHGMEGRVYYKKDEVLDSIKKIK